MREEKRPGRDAPAFFVYSVLEFGVDGTLYTPEPGPDDRLWASAASPLQPQGLNRYSVSGNKSRAQGSTLEIVEATPELLRICRH
ncbi:hypothetical protein [Deinococcus arenicola]|uniref:Uncharacterized protein n=1 Tax=Deinococcus arenicola TaxID=2994950 RepID=A0ABU4DKV1_9DEIO|nr:hypothetical protein [Deinococcus sp. ZS9-10]MDV6373047.1 hypothetical protein [Deinococcus sp. ZS9-10]